MQTLNAGHLELAISAITLCVAIICPVLVTILNNFHATHMRKLELKYEKQFSYYRKQQSVFNRFLEFASKQLESNYQSERTEYLRSYHEQCKAYLEFREERILISRERKKNVSATPSRKWRTREHSPIKCHMK